VVVGLLEDAVAHFFGGGPVDVDDVAGGDLAAEFEEFAAGLAGRRFAVGEGGGEEAAVFEAEHEVAEALLVGGRGIAPAGLGLEEDRLGGGQDLLVVNLWIGQHAVGAALLEEARIVT